MGPILKKIKLSPDFDCLIILLSLIITLWVLVPEFCCVGQGNRKGERLDTPEGSLCARLFIRRFTTLTANSPHAPCLAAVPKGLGVTGQVGCGLTHGLAPEASLWIAAWITVSVQIT